MTSERLLKDIEFIVELDKMKTILRQTTLVDKSKRENDAEHSWHISVMAMILSEYANEEIDICKVIKMLLIHDLVEIYAGDTFCYDVEGNKDKNERELKAADKIFGMLDKDKGMELKKLWEEFEQMETKEALFAASMDRLQPFFNNYFSGGGTWKKFDVSKKDIYKRIAPLKESSDVLWDFTKNMIEDAFDRGYIVRE
ncbi:MAG: HD domain-containing protein [Tissierellia bacterium]|mgnify:FL=1|nr:HD domain-containing protein [Tissierellia bacterium]